MGFRDTKSRPLDLGAIFGPGFGQVRREKLGFSGDRVVVAFVAPRATFPPWQLDVVLLDAVTGTLLGHHIWPVVSPDVDMIATRGGQFVIRMDARPASAPLRPNHEIILLSPKFEVLAELTLPLGREQGYEHWAIYPTPSTEFIITEHRKLRKIQVNWLDPATLKPKDEWDWTLPETPTPWDLWFDFSNRHCLLTLATRRGEGGCDISLKSVQGAWHTFSHRDGYCFGHAEFVGEDAIVSLDRKELTIFDGRGRILADLPLGSNNYPRAVRPSADGQRFAVAVTGRIRRSVSSGESQHETLQRIAVYDLSTKSWTASLDTPHSDPKLGAGFSLSGDGKLLGVLIDGIVQIYQLPAHQ